MAHKLYTIQSIYALWMFTAYLDAMCCVTGLHIRNCAEAAQF